MEERNERAARVGKNEQEGRRTTTVEIAGGTGSAVSDENIESKRTTRGGALCRREGCREARLAVWVMYWHMYVIVAICRESERPEEAVVADGESKRARESEIECGRKRARGGSRGKGGW